MGRRRKDGEPELGAVERARAMEFGPTPEGPTVRERDPAERLLARMAEVAWYATRRPGWGVDLWEGSPAREGRRIPLGRVALLVPEAWEPLLFDAERFLERLAEERLGARRPSYGIRYGFPEPSPEAIEVLREATRVMIDERASRIWSHAERAAKAARSDAEAGMGSFRLPAHLEERRRKREEDMAWTWISA